MPASDVADSAAAAIRARTIGRRPDDRDLPRAPVDGRSRVRSLIAALLAGCGEKTVPGWARDGCQCPYDVVRESALAA
ncbi:hypothetical protein GCM10009839_44790 [Catenulispora yoronensis]|uniref:Uncharacterized protein n=1 Tax=Catenulispora yoronensis TaxID=450799 RepID=A0ABN2UJ18_9ACTN